MCAGGRARACTHMAPFDLGFLSQISKCFARLIGFKRTVLQLVQVRRISDPLHQPMQPSVQQPHMDLLDVDQRQVGKMCN